jgi:hypothetical protein
MPTYRGIHREAEEICLYDRAMLRYDKENISIGRRKRIRRREEFCERQRT